MKAIPPIALLPGHLCTAELWRDQISFLESRFDTRVFVPDFAPFSSIADMAGHVLDKMDQPFVCCGLSMGGYATLEVFRQADPGQVKGIGLFDTSARADTDEQRKRRGLLVKMAKVGRFNGVSDKLLPTLIHEDRLDDKELTDRIKDMAKGVGRQGFFNQQEAIINRPDSVAHLADINIPALVICGRQDALTPVELSQEIASGTGEAAELRIIEDCGHLSTMEKPDAVNKILGDWLGAHF